jgi:tryptophan synthase alpha chain
MSAIDQLFHELRTAGRKAFMPFITAGDPDLDFTLQALGTLAEHGCHLCELGVPYSDPIADGPVIQASYQRALQNRIKLDQIWQAVSSFRPPRTMPLISMVSYSVIYRHGLELFVEHARQAGFAGVIVPDLLVEESAPLREICRREDFSLIPLITPTTAPDRAKRILATATGFVYYVSVTGVTGERRELPPEVLDGVAALRHETDLPICIGFGISRPEQVRLVAGVADGVIVGSAFVRRFAALPGRARPDLLEEIGRYADEMMDALRRC